MFPFEIIQTFVIGFDGAVTAMGMNTRAQQTAGIIGAIAFLGSLFVVLRLYTRFVLIRAPGWEDWVLICSWVRRSTRLTARANMPKLCAIATVTAIGIQTHYGMGGHGATLSAHENEMIGMVRTSLSQTLVQD